MFLNDVARKEQCVKDALQALRKLGVKCKVKKPKQQDGKRDGRIFKISLGSLPTEHVTLKSGQQVLVPKLVHHLCSMILSHVNTEGIFRKEGSRNRQKELKILLDRGNELDKKESVIDVAVLLKIFLRELPEPLIPWGYHELFLRCALLESSGQNIQALLLACLLLPVEHLSTLTYLMQFFQEVAQHSDKNKMTPYNLAVVIGPSVFPTEEKRRVTKINEIVEILIQNSLSVGIAPENIHNFGSNRDSKKIKRRSGSLTRMFNGLKKIVGGKSVEQSHNVVTPDLLLTPISNTTTKKRRIQANGISNKKRKELLNNLPENVLLSTPFTPCRTPVSMNLSGTHEKQLKNSTDLVKEKKWFSRSKSVKNLANEKIVKSCLNNKSGLERRWSAVSQPANMKKTKKRNSFAATTLSHKETHSESNKNEQDPPEPNYIRVSKEEYEAIKNRVSAMERRISIELETVQSLIKTENENNTNEEVDNNIKNVQTVYEQTLVQAEHLSPTTDQLAKRLSRELKIRRSSEQKIIRSPSARKIGSMRRRSKEFEKNNSRVSRHQSWHEPPKETIIPRVNLKRGRPNTVLTGLPTNRFENEIPENKEIKKNKCSPVETNSVKNISCNLSGSSSDTWVSAEGFFATMKTNDDSSSLSGRASLARLRSQNVGMVLAKAKLFDKLKDSDCSSSSSLGKSLPRPKLGTKIGSTRNLDSRLSCRVRSLKYEERRLSKKSMSPRKRNGCLTQKQKLQMAKQYLDSSVENSDKENIHENLNNLDKNAIVPLKDCNRIEGQQISSPKYCTPKAVPPHIKRSVNIRSPKRLCRTPAGIERSTPMRVLKMPHNIHT